MKPTDEQLREVRNALMECWTEKELNYVTRKYHDIIYSDYRMMRQLGSAINRIITVKEKKEIYA